MDLNEQLKSWIAEQQQPGSFLNKAGLGLAQAGQTLAQDAGAGAAILNDPRNSWIGMNPVGKAVSGGLGMAGMLFGQLGPKAEKGLLLAGKKLRPYESIQKDIDALEDALEKQGLNPIRMYDPTNPQQAILKGAGWTPEPPELTALYKERFSVEALEKGQFVDVVAKQTGLATEEAMAALKAIGLAPSRITASFQDDLNAFGKRAHTNIEDLYNYFAGKQYPHQGDALASFRWGGTADSPQLIGTTSGRSGLDKEILQKVEQVYNAVAENLGHPGISLSKTKGAQQVDDGKTLNLVTREIP